jgi:2-polyprenyl-3-methyl-5-hydroxy-6-metoxy-1,4-benzoquinol methylase
MKERTAASNYQYEDAANSHAHAYLLPTLKAELATLREELSPPTQPTLFDLRCGNGKVGAQTAADDWSVIGVDPSSDGIFEAQRAYPHLRFEQGSAYDDLADKYGRFPVVISLEVVDHVYAPRDFARTLFDLVEPGGTAMVSTPYHGYLKNLALAVTGKMDGHFTALWDHGHIKFWSLPTLSTLLSEAGFDSIVIKRVGRVTQLAKSMNAIARKPAL